MILLPRLQEFIEISRTQCYRLKKENRMEQEDTIKRPIEYSHIAKDSMRKMS